MKKYTIIVLAGIIATAVSCTKESPVAEKEGGNGEKYEMSFGATAQQTDSKAVLSGKDINWEITDEISVYDGSSLNTFTAKGVEGKSAEFTGKAAIAESYIAVYPASAASLNETDIKVTIPTTQTVDAAHAVDPAALVAVAKASAEGKLSFANKFSFVKMTVALEGITSIVLTGNNGEYIAGAAVLDRETLSVGDANKTKVTLKYKNGEFPKGDYYMVIYPTDFETGFRIVMTKKDGAKGARKTSVQSVFAMNGGIDLKTITSGMWVPQTITTAVELTNWARISDTYGSKESVKLGGDIDLGGSEWTPAPSFDGIFDGQNHRIYNFKVTADQNRVGFLSELGGTFKNVCFGSSDYDFTKGSVADAGTADGTSEFTSKISSDPETWTYIAPIAYSTEGAKISNVVNFVPVLAHADADTRVRCAGITAIVKGDCTIDGCVNYARVDNNATASTSNINSAGGGICAWAEGAKANTVSACVNRGEVMNKNAKAARIGGILGVSYSSDQTKVNLISNCQNYGSIENNVSSAGKANYLGGICACCGFDEDGVSMYGAVIEKCLNSGSVSQSLTSTKNLNAGGIAGAAFNGAQIKGCINAEKVGSTDAASAYGAHAYIGGIVGRAYRNVTVTKADDGTRCSNSGSIEQQNNFTANVCLGGICGFVDTEASVFSYCDNSGKVATTSIYVNETAKNNGYGGIVGYDNSKKSTYAHCSNSGEVNTTADNNSQPCQIAGIVGGKQSAKEISDCHNSGKIAYMKGTKDGYAGGICAILDPNFGTMSGCSNSGLILQNRNAKVAVGALAGLLKTNSGSSEVTICANCSVSAPASDNIAINATSAKDKDIYTLPDCGGLIFGKTNGSYTSNINVGPVTVKNGTIIYDKSNNKNYAVISSANYSDYLIGSSYTSAKLIFNCTVVD